jgi:hypothetical protein
MHDDKKPVLNDLALSLSDLRPEELEPRLELQVLVDPASLLGGVIAFDNNNNNNNNPPNNNNNNNEEEILT